MEQKVELPKALKLTSKSSRGEEIIIKRDEIFAQWDKPFGFEQHTINRVWYLTVHIFGGYMVYLNITGQAPWSSVAVGYFGGLGITVGCHRYWTHKTFKAELPLQYLLMIMQSTAFLYPIHKWCLDHRIHHKYTDTDADPHNSKRGFFFSHMGWVLLPKRKELQQKLKTFDMSDLENDPVVRFQSKWYVALAITTNLVVITIIYYTLELPLLACFASNGRRHVFIIHFASSVNSFAHMWGDKPYDKSITSTNNAFVSLFAVGEGWHNYHHTFPWDYKASEFGWKINFSTVFIDLFAYIGWAHDLKTVSQKMLKKRLVRTGDGTHSDVILPVEKHYEKKFEYPKQGDGLNCVWGWDDETLPYEFRKITKILKPGLHN